MVLFLNLNCLFALCLFGGDGELQFSSGCDGVNSLEGEGVVFCEDATVEGVDGVVGCIS